MFRIRSAVLILLVLLVNSAFAGKCSGCAEKARATQTLVSYREPGALKVFLLQDGL